MTNKFLELHRFFVRESRHYMGPYTWRTRLRWPSAYLRFMAYGVWDSQRVLAWRVKLVKLVKLVKWYRWQQ